MNVENLMYVLLDFGKVLVRSYSMIVCHSWWFKVLMVATLALPNFDMKEPEFCFSNTKSFKVNRQFVRNIELKLYDFFSTQRIFSGDVSIYNHHTWKLVRNLPKFLPQHPSMKSWYYEKFYDYQNLYGFNRIF